ncbi:MAG: hypothetical protein ACKO96_41910 [Flammeovirgaceae bacterium]
MKNQIKLTCAVFFLLAFSCEKKDPIKKADDRCGELVGKFVWNWCTEFGAIEVLSDKSIGNDWACGKKKYSNVVLAKLDSTLLNRNEDWSKVIGSPDSVIYFNYLPNQFDYGLVCKVLGGPTKTISITSFGSRLCTSNSNN